MTKNQILLWWILNGWCRWTLIVIIHFLYSSILIFCISFIRIADCSNMQFGKATDLDRRNINTRLLIVVVVRVFYICLCVCVCAHLFVSF